MKKHQSNNDIENELQDFPTHRMSKETKEIMHQNIMNALAHDQEKERRWMKMRKFTTAIASVAALGLFVLLGYSMFLDNNTTPNGNEDQTNQITTQDEEQDEIINLDKETAKDIMDQYKQSLNVLYETSGENGLITMYDSIDEVREHFRQVMSEDLADWMTDSYIKEENGEVYLIAKDGPTWLANDQEFELEQVNEQLYNLNQERNNEMLGHVMMTYQLKWAEDRWVVHSIESTHLDDQQQNEEAEQPSVKELATDIINLLDDRNTSDLADYVHEQQGLLFSPYVYVEDDALVFTKEEVASLMEDEQIYEWGTYDGRGNPIELTPGDYFDEFVQVEPLIDTEDIYTDQANQHGNVTNNIKEIFPESTVIEFYDNGSEEYGSMDWSAVHLVFEQNEQEEWKLVAIVNDEWTI
ncbi:hypothetical protein [Aquibacillus sediminis]|uniref:hypothetical protein n=1 Tax=Aquibacillus sediminis TaxID=2574734 RepID=UPI0011082A51|nr:hypothetical protein [Aquibacillus sediminis]